MNAPSPQVSVIIATHNDANKVGLAVTSVLEQGFQNLEIIIVNDASTDHTTAVLEKFRQRDPRVVLLTNSICLGRAEARNVAIRQARADLLAILDSDDQMLPSRLNKQVEFMQQNYSIGVLGSWAIFNLDGKLMLARTPTEDAEIRRRLQRGENAIINTSMIIRTSLASSVGGYQSSPYSSIYNEDYYTLIGLCSKTRFAALPEPLIVVNAGGLTEPERIKTKLVEKMRLDRHLFWDHPSVARLIRTTMGTFLTMALPSTYLSELYRRRLLRLPVYDFPEHIRAWKRHLERKRREIEMES